MGRPPTGKQTVSIRLDPETIAGVKIAAAVTGNLSAWIEDAIKYKLGAKKLLV